MSRREADEGLGALGADEWRPGPGHRSGFVSLVGRPNVGKSTLLNKILGTKVSITSPRPQTTRNEIRGVLHRPDAQVVFIDTPGVHRPRSLLGERLNERSLSTFAEVDVVCVLIEAHRPIGGGDTFVAQALAKVGTPRVLVVNKVDLATRASVGEHLAIAESRLGAFDAYVPLSASTGEGVPTLIEELVSRLEPGPRYYPEGTLTDQPETFLVAELVREKLLAVARDELPHSIAVTVDELEERPGGVLAMRAVVLVERDSQKGIVIGRDGKVLRDAGTAARLELEALLGARVHLELFVKVESNWQRRAHALDRLGY